MPKNRLGLCLAILCAALCGCGQTSPSATSSPPPSESHRATDDGERLLTGERVAGQMAAMSRPVQPGAAGAVESTLEAFRNGRLEIVYDFLPPEFQRDLTQLVREFAEKVDPELWEMTTQVLQKAVDVLRQKRSLIVPLLAQSDRSSQDVAAAWDDFVNAADRLVRGPLADRGQWAQIDLREALRTDLSRATRRLMVLSSIANPPERNPLRELDEVQVDLVEMTDHQAWVRITPREGTNVEATLFVYRGGKWIPKSLADAWPEIVESARERVRHLSDVTALPDLQRFKEQLRVVDRVLDQMLTATNADQLASAATPLVLQATQWSVPMTAPAVVLPDGPAEGVSMFISRELTDAELTQLLRTLEPLTDDPALEYHLATANGGKTFISIKPVKDIAAFAAKLTFATDVTIDASARTITLRDVRVP